MSQRFDDFREKCEAFDWNYELNDDRDMYRAGRTAQASLFSDAMQIGPDALDLYFSFIPGREVH